MLREFKKIYSRPVSVGLLVAAALLSIGLSIFFIRNYEYEIREDGNTVYYSGRHAVEMEKEALHHVPSVLSVENLNEALAYYHSFTNTDMANEAFDKKYPGWRNMFRDAYVPVIKEDLNLLDKKNQADDFYEEMLKRLPEWMAGYDGVIYTEAEKGRAASLLSSVRKPYVYEFCGQWTILLKASFIFFYAVILYAVFLAGQIFSYEKDCSMDLVLIPCGKKKALRSAYQKLGGVFGYLTCITFLCILIQILVIFIYCGVSGRKNSIQTIWGFFSCLYNMTNEQFFIYSYITAWISILCIAAVSALLNAYTKNRYLSIAITALLLIFPSVLEGALSKSAILQRFTFLQPMTGIKVLTYGPSLRTFSVGPLVLRGGDAVLLECMILFILASWLAPKVYWKQMRR